MRDRLAHWLLSVAIVLLPWQTTWIVSILILESVATPFGVSNVYLVEMLILFAALLRGRPQLIPGTEKATQALYVFLAAGFLSLTFADQYHLGLFRLLHVIIAGARKT